MKRGPRDGSSVVRRPPRSAGRRGRSPSSTPGSRRGHSRRARQPPPPHTRHALPRVMTGDFFPALTTAHYRVRVTTVHSHLATCCSSQVALPPARGGSTRAAGPQVYLRPRPRRPAPPRQAPHPKKPDERGDARPYLGERDGTVDVPVSLRVGWRRWAPRACLLGGVFSTEMASLVFSRGM
jgi:hypothetical protein